MDRYLSPVFDLSLSLGVIAAFIVCYILLVISKGNLLLKRLLVGLTASICLLFILIGYSRDHALTDLTFLPQTFFPLHYIIPPLFFLYFRTFIRDENRLSKNDLVHLLPLGLHLLYISPLILDILLGEVTWAHLLSSGQGPEKQIAFGPIPNNVHTLMRITVSIAYLGLMWKYYLSSSFSDFIVHNKDLFPKSILWIKFFVWVITLLGISGVLLKAEFLIPGLELENDHRRFLTWMIIFSFLGMLLYLILKPVILFGLPHFLTIGEGDQNVKKVKTANSPTVDILTLSENTHSEVIENRPPDSIHNNFLRLRILPQYFHENYPNRSEHQKILMLIDRIDHHVEDQKPYTKSDWNMHQLSKELNIPKYHLLFIFSQVLKYSFVDYRNELRVKHAQQLLRKGTNVYQTIESIGLDAGFPSRATFFSVFKKLTEMTPEKYVEINELNNA